MVEHELRRAGDHLFVDHAHFLHELRELFARGIKEIRETDHIDCLVVVDRTADVDGCHFDVNSGASTRYFCGCGDKVEKGEAAIQVLCDIVGDISAVLSYL